VPESADAKRRFVASITLAKVLEGFQGKCTTWLTGVNKELGPAYEESPHKLASPQNVEYPATADNICSTPGLEFLGKLPPSIRIGRCAATELMLLIAA